MAAVSAAIIGALGARADTMTRNLRPLAAVAVIAMVVLVAACGSNAPSESGTASNNSAASVTGTASNDAVGSAPGSASTAGDNSASKVEDAVKFAECMRNNGVSEFPDPNASGDFAYGIKAGSPLDPSSTAWQHAISACKNLEPAGLIPTHFTTQQIAARLKFAQCMRANGVPNFPDPTSNGPLIVVRNAQSNPAIQAGLQKCRTLLAAASGGQ
jgi:hypothetical protein